MRKIMNFVNQTVVVSKMKPKIIFLHGNGGGTSADNWFPYLQEALTKLDIEVTAKDFPDPELARAKYWLPFLREELKADENSILIGHSSGAVAAMRYAEENKILGSILVGSYYSDLGNENEKKSGYFDKPWDWNTIRSNQSWVVVFASTDDPYIPIDQARFIKEKLKAEYYEFTDQGHFGSDQQKTEFPEIIEVIKKKLNLHDPRPE